MTFSALPDDELVLDELVLDLFEQPARPATTMPAAAMATKIARFTSALLFVVVLQRLAPTAPAAALRTDRSEINKASCFQDLMN
jgi:hypothetical protein